MVAISFGASLGLSPFAAVAVAMVSGMFLYNLRNIRDLGFSIYFRREQVRSIELSAFFLSVGISLSILGVCLGSSPLSAGIFLAFGPIAVLAGRRLICNEDVTLSQRIGMLLGVAVCAFWMVCDPFAALSDSEQILSLNPHFLSDALVFLGSVSWALAFSLFTPAAHGFPAASYWSWASLGAVFITLPAMAVLQVVFFGTLRVFSAQANDLNLSLTSVMPFIVFGMVAMSYRFLWLGQASRVLPSSVVSCTWTSTFLLTLLLCSSLGGKVPSVIHLVSFLGLIGGTMLAQAPRKLVSEKSVELEVTPVTLQVANI
jgi:hypothetical protein